MPVEMSLALNQEKVFQLAGQKQLFFKILLYWLFDLLGLAVKFGQVGQNIQIMIQYYLLTVSAGTVKPKNMKKKYYSIICSSHACPFNLSTQSHHE